jgi:hypothetical protein
VGSPAATYKIKCVLDASGTAACSDVGQVSASDLARGSTQGTLTGLTPGKAYTCFVIAYNSLAQLNGVCSVGASITLTYATGTTCGDYDAAAVSSQPFTNAMCSTGKEYDSSKSGVSIAGDAEAAAIGKCCKVCVACGCACWCAEVRNGHPVSWWLLQDWAKHTQLMPTNKVSCCAYAARSLSLAPLAATSMALQQARCLLPTPCAARAKSMTPVKHLPRLPAMPRQPQLANAARCVWYVDLCVYAFALAKSRNRHPVSWWLLQDWAKHTLLTISDTFSCCAYAARSLSLAPPAATTMALQQARCLLPTPCAARARITTPVKHLPRLPAMPRQPRSANAARCVCL